MSCLQYIETKQIFTIKGGSYISAHVLMNLLNELGKKIRCEAFGRDVL